MNRRSFLKLFALAAPALAVGKGKKMPNIESKASASLGGKRLILTSPVAWKLTEGVLPSINTFDIAPEDALALAKSGGGPFTLEIDPSEGNPVKVDNLWVLTVDPGPDPWISQITVADRRWMWSYVHVLLRMNMRRNVGVKRILANDQFAVAFDRAPDVAFAKFSLDRGEKTRYVALSMMQKVLQQISDFEKENYGSGFDVTIDDRVGSKIGTLPIEQLEIDDEGDGAVRRALAYLPDAGITVDYDGKVIVFSKAAGDEESIVQALLPELRDQGHTDLVKNANIRPRKIRVYFTREVEVRFDYIESAQAQGGTQVQGQEPLGERRPMDNVVPVTDYQLSVDGQTVPQGTWITFDQAFRAWGTLPIKGAPKAIDHRVVQRAFIPQNDLWAPLKAAGSRPDQQGNLKPWIGRICATEANYRQTFRLNRRWMDRALSVRAYRLATIDPQSGQRGPARAYGDYAVLYTQRSIAKNRAEDQNLEYANNRSAFPTGGNLDANAEPSPAEVTIIDADQGIIRVDYRGTNPLSGDTRTILPSQIAGNPSWAIGRKDVSITFDSIINGSNPPRLSPSFRLATVLTLVPASPNSKAQLHMIEISPSDVTDLLPAGLRAGLAEANGPIMEIRIGANVEVARIQWSDDRVDDIEKIFGLSGGSPADPKNVPNLDGLVLNDGDKTDLNRGGSLNLIARAAAARVYASLTDRYEGEMTGPMNGGVHLSGNVSEIQHRYMPKGDTVTQVNFPPNVPQMNLLAFLDSNTRAAILHQVQPQ